MSFLALIEEIWNIPNIHVTAMIVLNLAGALVLGLIVGYERTYRGRAAGMRTYGLVCMASSALTVIAGYSAYWYGGQSSNIGLVDPTRVIQGIVTGIGFLGAGIIMKDGYTISGLTTAASIWASSAIGILCGVGFYSAAVLLTFLSVIFMLWGLKVESWLPARPSVAMMLKFQKGYIPLEMTVRKFFDQRGYTISSGSIAITHFSKQMEWRFVAYSDGKKIATTLVSLSHDLAALEHLDNFQISQARN